MLASVMRQDCVLPDPYDTYRTCKRKGAVNSLNLSFTIE